MTDFETWLKDRITNQFREPHADFHRSVVWLAFQMLAIHADDGSGVCKTCKTPSPCLTLRVHTYAFGFDTGPDGRHVRAPDWREEWWFTHEEIHGDSKETFVVTGPGLVRRLADVTGESDEEQP